MEAAIQKNRQRSQFITEEISYIQALTEERKKAKMARQAEMIPPTPRLYPINLDETS